MKSPLTVEDYRLTEESIIIDYCEPLWDNCKRLTVAKDSFWIWAQDKSYDRTDDLIIEQGIITGISSNEVSEEAFFENLTNEMVTEFVNDFITFIG